MEQAPDAQLLRVPGSSGIMVYLASGPDALRDILNTHAYDFVKPWGIRVLLGRAIGWGLVVSEGPEHKKQKKALTPAFHVRRIRELCPLMWEKTRILLEELEKDVKKHPEGNEGFGLVEVGEWSR